MHQHLKRNLLQNYRRELADRRITAKISQSVIARLVGVDKGSISRFENDGTELSQNFYAIVLAYAHALNEDPQVLLGEAAAELLDEGATVMQELAEHWQAPTVDED